MGKYFGREPRYSREEIERQAQEAIDARVGMGRPPAEDWSPLEARLSEIDRVMAARPPVPPVPPVPEPQPMQIREVRMPRPAESAPAKTAQPAGARLSRRPLATAPSGD
ncbi:MAG: hypothetical protein M3450_17325 [Actinomycetota bacterium]|nr:hypothetical protein [Actinomycetota bacterium]